MNHQIEVGPGRPDTGLVVTNNLKHFKRSAGDCHERLAVAEFESATDARHFTGAVTFLSHCAAGVG